MIRRSKAAAIFTATVLSLAGLVTVPAQAQFFSNKDGYADDGSPRLQVELAPYLWWPGFGGSVKLASPLVNDRTPGSFSTGLLSTSLLKDVLHAAIIGAGIVRYGPFSAEMDIQYLSVSESKNLVTSPAGEVFRVKTAVELVRVAPGVGYQVYAGDVFGIPTSVDARAGFSYLATSETFTGEAALTGLSSSNSTGFVQPWLGARADFVLSPRWRIELGGLVQGLGVSGGSWGWGASGNVSYAMTDWAALTFGARALETERFGDSDTARGSRRSLSLVTYGPIIGVSFRF
ncbi:MAG: hypothetical protein P4L90_00750 [Rhodopila sp.]|nr:hypothetical protein [Rhodopila sp.]